MASSSMSSSARRVICCARCLLPLAYR
jgi:hypothetical protein